VDRLSAGPAPLVERLSRALLQNQVSRVPIPPGVRLLEKKLLNAGAHVAIHVQLTSKAFFENYICKEIGLIF
jgi:hypothetical protein